MTGTIIAIGQIETALGAFGAAVSPRGLARLTFPGESLDLCQAWTERWWPGATLVSSDSRLDRVAAQLQAYLANKSQQFTLDLDLRGTPFQLEVWQALLRIPYGQTRSYSELAASIGRPRAVRAVGRANAANPVPVVVPCHRVIGSNGELVGFGGGLPLKRELLVLEGCLMSC